MRRIPQIQGVMTPFPYAVRADDDVRTARAMMDEHRIRHLPVICEGEIVGMLSDRDLRVVDSIWSQDAAKIMVGDICSEHPYVVEHTEPLDRVVQEMERQGIGSVIITKEGKLSGVLTTTDVCRVLVDTLRDFFRPPDATNAA